MSETGSNNSVIGLLLYLRNTTRPDIAAKVSKIMCFGTGSPNKEVQVHALNAVVSYLQGTKDKCLSFKDHCTGDCGSFIPSHWLRKSRSIVGSFALHIYRSNKGSLDCLYMRPLLAVGQPSKKPCPA
ncbi:expressed unknown protein [Seminavis robusta]|uniref:Uncharacterized protein n=1 Tax=Seminavis robusta TaxID=568900 RepID=A0A9N8E719_9STRA|nr:expressed unknown protein [Seminavis robusta]|eukprot:Sro619_g176351.1  (127) ;mRNA; r:4202-4582